MAVGGRKPTPIGLVHARGNPGKRKLPDEKKLIHAPIEEPGLPSHLSDDAKAEWDRIVPILVDLKLMTKLDRGPLAAYCQAYGRWVEAERALAGENLVRVNLSKNPLVAIANKAMADMMRYAVEFGMTPSARMRVQTSGSGADENPFEAFRKTGT